MNTSGTSVSQTYELASDCMSRLMTEATRHVSAERESIRVLNEPEIKVLRMREEYLSEKWQTLAREATILSSRVQLSRDAGSGVWNLLIASSLVMAAFCLSLTTLEPFNMGWKAWVYCFGLAVALPFAVDQFLERFRHRAVVGALISGMLLLSLATAYLFGFLRADVLTHFLDSSPAVVIDGSGVSEQVAAVDSGEIVAGLRRVWSWAALTFELLAGLAIFQFREARRSSDVTALLRVEKEALKVETELLGVVRRIRDLLAEPARFEAGFWDSFERGLRDGRNTGGPFGRLASLVLGVLLTSATTIRAAEIIAAVDLSKTQIAAGLEGKSEFEKNIRAITNILGTMPAGSRIRITAITDQSFATPFTVMSAGLSSDTGYFSNRLRAGRQRLVAEWQKRSKALEPRFNQTDILGACRYSGELFAQGDTKRKTLVLLSDMRQYTAELDLEKPSEIDVRRSLKRVDGQGGFARLDGVQVYVFGAGDHGGTKGTRYWNGLRQFWEEFVRRSGGSLKLFSPTRDAEALRGVTAVPAMKTGAP